MHLESQNIVFIESAYTIVRWANQWLRLIHSNPFLLVHGSPVQSAVAQRRGCFQTYSLTTSAPSR
jgi:hypothetical protein